MNFFSNTRLNAAFATSVLFALVACGGESAPPPPPAPTVATLTPIRGSATLTREEHEDIARLETRVEEGAVVETAADARISLHHDGGAWILFDRATRVQPTLDSIRIESGRVFVDARRGNVTILLEGGEIRAEGATFAIDARSIPTVYCASGELTWLGGDGADSERATGYLSQGETLTFSAEPAPEAATLWDDWTGGLADPSPWRAPSASYVGVLAGRRLDELGVARRPVSLRSHEVEAQIHGDLATTEVIQTFFNAESATLEAHYRMRVPEGAIVSAFAVDTGGGFVEASVAVGQANGYLPAWGLPSYAESRLAYDGPTRVRGRVYPIEPGATVRVRIRYSHWMKREGDRRTYVYPMVDQGVEPPLVGEFRMRVSTAGNRVGGLRAGMGATVNAGEVVVRRSDYHPTTDFYLDIIDPQSESAEESIPAYVVNAPPPVAMPGQRVATDEADERFVLFDVAASALDLPEAEPVPLDIALVVDVSGATAAEDLELARGVVESVLRQLAPTDRVSLLLGDVRAHAPEGLDGGFIEATEENAERILEALARAPLGGATDLGRMLRQASVLTAGRPLGTVLYLGDGIPTTGELDASAISRGLATVEGAPRLFALALGESAGTDLLGRICEHAENVSRGTDASRAVMRILADAARPMLRGAQVDFGSTVERVFPRLPRTVALDEPLRLIGRLRGDLPATITVTGTIGGEPFSKEIDVRGATVDDGGDIRRRWASARLAELIDADEGREALIELGQRFGLLTPWTSFLVGVQFGFLYSPVPAFDRDPTISAIVAPTRESGWRRGRAAGSSGSSGVGYAQAAESTWRSRVDVTAVGTASGESGLSIESVRRTLARGERGPRTCYDRRLLTRPDLQGNVRVSVSVNGDGTVAETKLEGSSLGEADVSHCVVAEVGGLRFPATGGSQVTVQYSYTFAPSAAIGRRRSCSDASRQGLEVRRNLWRERLAANSGPAGAISVWGHASSGCELSSWPAKRALLDLMLRGLPGLQNPVALYRGLRHNAGVGSYLRRAILRRVQTPQQVNYVRRVLGLEANVDWSYFSRRWNNTRSPEARLALVRRWLEVLTNELDLRLRELALLEELGRLPEARRLAERLRADPLADAAVYAAVGEFYLRQEDEAAARRVFSELVEYAPYDPWARRRLGDLYRAHGWYDDAYREYGSLARLQPDDPSVLLLLARAAGGAGRTDEALRLEQRLAERSEPGKIEGVAGLAQLWTLTRLISLSLGEQVAASAISERLRQTGLLRSPPAVMVMFTWAHPEDAPEIWTHIPSTPVGTEWERAEIQSKANGIEAIVVPERDDDEEIRIEIRRADRDNLRDLTGTLWVALDLGGDNQRFFQAAVRLTREDRKQAFVITDGLTTR